MNVEEQGKCTNGFWQVLSSSGRILNIFNFEKDLARYRLLVLETASRAKQMKGDKSNGYSVLLCCRLKQTQKFTEYCEEKLLPTEIVTT